MMGDAKKGAFRIYPADQIGGMPTLISHAPDLNLNGRLPEISEKKWTLNGRETGYATKALYNDKSPSGTPSYLHLSFIMVLRIYGMPRSTSTKRIVVVCKEKNIPYRLVSVKMLENEHKSPTFLEHQPFGQIPYAVVRPS